MIDAAPADKKAEAYLARYQYRTEFGLPEADEDLDRALAAAESRDAKDKNIDVLLAGGTRAFRNGEHEAAIGFFSEAIEASPDDRRGYLTLGRLYAQQEDHEQAYEVLRKGVERAGEADLGLQLEAASALISLKRLKQAGQAIDRLEKQVALTISREQPGWLMAVNMLRAKAALADNDHLTAVAHLHRIASLQRSGARAVVDASGEAQVQWLLGRSYESLGAWDQAGSAFGKAADAQPQVAGLRLAAAAAWNAAGRVDEAVRQYEDGLAIDDTVPEAWAALAAALFQQQVTRPSPQRDWTRFEEVLRRSQTLSPDSTLLKLLEADFEATRGRLDLALELLHACELAAGDDQELLARVALRYEQLRQPTQADRLLAELRQRNGTESVP
ncbi:MAG: tetratricopeptide repeat protein, partial [Candidatus Saccharimonadales bacterium]